MLLLYQGRPLLAPRLRKSKAHLTFGFRVRRADLQLIKKSKRPHQDGSLASETPPETILTSRNVQINANLTEITTVALTTAPGSPQQEKELKMLPLELKLEVNLNPFLKVTDGRGRSDLPDGLSKKTEMKLRLLPPSLQPEQM